MAKGRKILHVDMDAFYASIEQRDDPSLRGRPVVVGGSPHGRGVVCAASYEARGFGVHSAMPSTQAHRLCPQAIFLPPRFEVYTRVSRQVRAVFFEHARAVEPLSLDEAYLDVTHDLSGCSSATESAQVIRRKIRSRTGLTASAGAAPNKFLAKVASDKNKPDGLCVVRPSEVEDFLRDLPVRRIPGIGARTEERCQQAGIRVCSDFLRFGLSELRELFGQAGEWFFELARGRDERPICTERRRKSCGIEETFARDLVREEEILSELETLAARLEARMRRHDLLGERLTLKVKDAAFQVTTRSATLAAPGADRETILRVAYELLPRTPAGQRPVRLLGLAFSRLVLPEQERQLLLPFDEPPLA